MFERNSNVFYTHFHDDQLQSPHVEQHADHEGEEVDDAEGLEHEDVDVRGDEIAVDEGGALVGEAKEDGGLIAQALEDLTPDLNGEIYC